MEKHVLFYDEDVPECGQAAAVLDGAGLLFELIPCSGLVEAELATARATHQGIGNILRYVQAQLLAA
ncbi:hypothetical protein HY493_00870 [Candidatus Woesearchaeota archaeon]|nr:hypothetical protein [Candidatus Woesearchaeota archaeon]